MFTYTKTAGDVVNAVIQDGQVQTTNRNALLDYTNRVSNRILRESKWIFLRSPEYRFITRPDVEKYWIGSGSSPVGCVNTGLNLSDIDGILSDSVMDLTNMRSLQPDVNKVFLHPGFRYRDGAYVSSRPRAWGYDPNRYGVFYLDPPPDGSNNFQPVPSSPVCNWVSGGSLPTRRYYVKVTLVDSVGGESLPCERYSDTVVPSGYLLTVQSPTVEVTSANTVSYPFYNVYLSDSSFGPFYLVNETPITQGGTWTEDVSGFIGVAIPQTILVNDDLGGLWTLGVQPDGLLVATNQGTTTPAPDTYLKDGAGDTWFLQVNHAGNATVLQEASLVSRNLVLYDGLGGFWTVGIGTDGLLTTTAGGNPTLIQPPQTATIMPLNGYVISFMYQKNKVPINSTGQTLQIPDEYFDVVIAGVNFYASLYTAKSDDLAAKVGMWKKEFMDGLSQMRRDLRQQFRETDFISPDQTTQYAANRRLGF